MRGVFERQGLLLEARGAAGDMCCALIKPLEVMHLQPKKIYLVWMKTIVIIMAGLQEENQSEITSKMPWHISNLSNLPLLPEQAEAREVSWALCIQGIWDSENQSQHSGLVSNPPNHPPSDEKYL